MASGIAHGHVHTTAVESRKMAAILQVIGWQRHATLVYLVLFWYIMLWSIHTFQIKLSADQYHMTISWTQVYSSSRSSVLIKLTACSVLYRRVDIPEVSVKKLCFVSIPRCLVRVCVCTCGSHVDGAWAIKVVEIVEHRSLFLSCTRISHRWPSAGFWLDHGLMSGKIVENRAGLFGMARFQGQNYKLTFPPFLTC